MNRPGSAAAFAANEAASQHDEGLGLVWVHPDPIILDREDEVATLGPGRKADRPPARIFFKDAVEEGVFH